MKNWKALLEIGGAFAVLGGLAWLFGGRRVSKNPLERIEGLPTAGTSVEKYYAVLRGQIGWGKQTALLPTAAAQNVWKRQETIFATRFKEAGDFALAHPEITGKGNDGVHGKFGAAPDKFSKQSFLVYRPENTNARVIDGRVVYGQPFSGAPVPWGWFLTDEYGRPYEGWGYGGNGAAFALELARQALPLVPGLGTAGGAALGAAIALGQGKSLSEASLAAARGALPPGAQLAFDAGVGAYQGRPVDEIALDALESRYPGSKDAYAKGKIMAKAAT